MTHVSAILVSLCLLMLSGCAQHSGLSIEIAKNAEEVIIFTGENDSFNSIAKRYLGNSDLKWRIQDHNDINTYQPGLYLSIPLARKTHFGFYDDYEQQVPILVYHNFGRVNTATTITADKFKQQLLYLVNNNFRVISLKQYFQHIQLGQQIPKRAVIITIDDGYRATYSIAFPILKALNLPATVFIYSDYISNGGLSKKQLNIMQASALIDVQPHSKTHRNFNRLHKAETQQAYLDSIDEEVEVSTQKVAKTLNSILSPRFFAYPYGEVNPVVTDKLTSEGFDLAFTVVGQSNKAYNAPLLLKRYQIFGNHSFEKFQQIIESNKDFH
ncbi:polysaccharide deacetylase family protein [Thalassotalea euphylliae]|uniref:Polysaccharide deacetylase family protein n=1 Tax=Thalassotalea euphylliae TaxID=1655234 RepID=A0A3E0TQU7_9GAMM|nr:polysaccharide deacetylase family protein [Thalassotalea euphylliae]REL26710.1 polysaccharide deacetylase family protein [Thalassotalea euphylliae]